MKQAKAVGGGIAGTLASVAVILNFFSDDLGFARKSDVEALEAEIVAVKEAANRMAWELAWMRYGDNLGPPPPPDLFSIP